MCIRLEAQKRASGGQVVAHSQLAQRARHFDLTETTSPTATPSPRANPRRVNGSACVRVPEGADVRTTTKQAIESARSPLPPDQGSIADAAAYLKVHPSTVYRWV